jgi:hypothetical protein
MRETLAKNDPVWRPQSKGNCLRERKRRTATKWPRERPSLSGPELTTERIRKITTECYAASTTHGSTRNPIAVGENPRARLSHRGNMRCFASSAERPGSGSPRTTMFGVCSAAHAACRSAKTAPGAERNNEVACPDSASSLLHRPNPRIPTPFISLSQLLQASLRIEARLCENRAQSKTGVRWFFGLSDGKISARRLNENGALMIGSRH